MPPISGMDFVHIDGVNSAVDRGQICHYWRQRKIFANGVKFSIFTHFFVFLSLKLLKLGEIGGVKV